jgi:hypothetical protein
MNTEAASDQLELPPDAVEFIKHVATVSAFQPNATPDMITSVTQIQPHSYDYGAFDCFRATTISGLDLIITEMPRDKYWDPDDPTFDETTDWKPPTVTHYNNDKSRTIAPISDGYYLEGLLEQMSRTLDLEKGRFTVRLMTGPDRFNAMMTALGKRPGVDCFKQTPIAGGQFSARSLVEAASKLEIPAAVDEAIYVEHDRKLVDHVQAWWSMPPELALHLQQRANEVLAMNDDEAIATFADGLDQMEALSKLIVPEVFRILDSEWTASETANDRLRELRNFIAVLASHVGAEDHTELGEKYSVNIHTYANRACVALIQTGLLSGIPLTESDVYDRRFAIFPSKTSQDSAEVLKAREALAYWGVAVARNATDMLSHAAKIQHRPTNNRREDLIGRIATEFTEPYLVIA